MGSTFLKFFSLFKICCNFFGFRIALSRRVCYATYIYQPESLEFIRSGKGGVRL